MVDPKAIPQLRGRMCGTAKKYFENDNMRNNILGKVSLASCLIRERSKVKGYFLRKFRPRKRGSSKKSLKKGGRRKFQYQCRCMKKICLISEIIP